jgi:hypothetical protein
VPEEVPPCRPSSGNHPSPAQLGPTGDCPRVATTAKSNQADDEDIFRILGLE